MQKKGIWISIGVGVIAVIVALILAFGLPDGIDFPSFQTSGSSGTENDTSKTREVVPVGTVVPDTSSANLPPEVVVPQTVRLSGGSSSPNLRSFVVTVENNALSQNTITAYVGDILTLTFQSKDKEYDFVQPDYGLTWRVPANDSKTFQFQATATGKFIFYCPSCGGPEKGPTGYIIAASP